MFTRREILASAAAATVLKAAPLALRLKIVVAGGHPGDPECGCAGTIARYAALGHDVVLLYLNRGEGFCSGGSPCAMCQHPNRRSSESLPDPESAPRRSRVRLTVKPSSTTPTTRIFSGYSNAEKPDVIFTQWPIDEHRDHRAYRNLRWMHGSKADGNRLFIITRLPKTR